jgi:hypothetical protein
MLTNILVGKRKLGRPSRKWKDNIEMDFRKSGLMVWIGFVWPKMDTGGGLL